MDSQAVELKAEGNEHFKAKRWEEALVAYRAGVGRLPKRRPPRKKKEEGDGDRAMEEDGVEGSADPGQDESDKQPEEEPEEPEDTEIVKTRAILNANIAACYVQMNDHKLAVEACTEALLDDPHYVKALQRRAASNEKLATWSAYTSAQEDYTTLLTLLPPNDPAIKQIEKSQASLKPRLEAAQKKETEEMLGKLKGIGNSILGNFGLSTDNFQFVPNGQGGYSMNFTR